MWETITITIEGLSCEHCEQTVEEALESVSGVRTAEADRDAEQATIHGDVDTDALVAAVEDAGYNATTCRAGSDINTGCGINSTFEGNGPLRDCIRNRNRGE